MDDPGLKNLSDFDKQFPDEQACRDYLEKSRWKGTSPVLIVRRIRCITSPMKSATSAGCAGSNSR